VETAEPPSYPPADLRRRALARMIDLLLAIAPLLLVTRKQPRAGELLCLLLLLAADSLFGNGRSLGKRGAGLRVIALATRRPAGILACLRRNAVFAVAPLPALLGARNPLAVTLLALAVICALEAGVALRPLTRDLGQRRVGDLLAGTQVIDGSVALGLPQAARRDATVAAAPLVTSRAARGSSNSPPPAIRPRARPGPSVHVPDAGLPGEACASL
jgi:uncharacterized RDD family membrane protein YckC